MGPGTQPRYRGGQAALSRVGAAALLAAGLGLWAGAGAQALAEPTSLPGGLPTSLPAPVGAVVGDTVLTGPVDTVTGTVTVTGATPGAVGDADRTGPEASVDEAAGSSGSPAPSTAPAARGEAASPGNQPASQSSPPASVRAQTPVASACIIPTGGSSPAVGIDLEALGADLGTPLAEGVPQVFTPCPEGTVPPGDRILGADADVDGLVGACVRVTREVAPVQTTVVVLDRHLVEELVAAGLPLEDLVEPCPSALAEVPAAGGPGAAGADGVPGGDGADHEDSGQPGLPDRLPYTGSNPGPLVAVATALLSVGAVLVRGAQLLAVRA